MRLRCRRIGARPRPALRRVRTGFQEVVDEGFTIVEVLVAITLLTVVLLAVERGAIVDLSAASVAKEHAVATSLISGDIAQVVALPFNELQSGLNPSAESLGTDDPKYIQCVSGTCTFLLNGATIPTTNTTSDAPLVPHATTVNLGIPYTVATYPTTSAISNLITVTVVVTWTAPTGGTMRAVGQTQIAPP
jgi:prepilin-type N-terminal cleavage/methylation domain-containing protein